jgi:hypothetical protein
MIRLSDMRKFSNAIYLAAGMTAAVIVIMGAILWFGHREAAPAVDSGSNRPAAASTRPVVREV